MERVAILVLAVIMSLFAVALFIELAVCFAGQYFKARKPLGSMSVAMLQGRGRVVETLFDVWSLPISRGILAFVLTLALAAHWLHVFALLCAVIAVLYAVESARFDVHPMQELARWLPHRAASSRSR
jgi:1,4-dihydroxy-2-naphthoate octaprenyltransferase